MSASALVTFPSSMRRPSNKNNQPVALLASFNATSKKRNVGGFALPFQRHWQCCLLQRRVPLQKTINLRRCWPPSTLHPKKTINLWRWWFGSIFDTSMPRLSKKNNQPAALLASHDATSKKSTCGIGVFAPHYQRLWQHCLLQQRRVPPKKNPPAALLPAFDATSRKKSTCGVGGLVPCLHQRWRRFLLLQCRIPQKTAALLASLDATSKKKESTCGIGGLAPRSRGIPPTPRPTEKKNNLGRLASFDATSRKKFTCGVGGLVPCLQRRW